MSKINSSKVLVNLAGVSLRAEDKELTLGAAVSNILLSYTKGDKMRNFILAKDFYKGNDVEVNSADVALLKTACEQCEIYNNLVIGQILEILEAIKK